MVARRLAEAERLLLPELSIGWWEALIFGAVDSVDRVVDFDSDHMILRVVSTDKSKVKIASLCLETDELMHLICVS